MIFNIYILYIYQIFIEHFILKQKNIPSSQHLMVPSPKLTINSSQNKPKQIQED